MSNLQEAKVAAARRKSELIFDTDSDEAKLSSDVTQCENVNMETSRTLHRRSLPILTGSVFCPEGSRGLLAWNFSSQREATLVSCISACRSNT